MPTTLRFKYIPLDEATQPKEGFADVMLDRFWVHVQGKGLLFVGRSPQCNKSASIVETIIDRCKYENAEALYVPVVFLSHNCSDYLGVTHG